MSPALVLKEALKSLRRNPLRSGLTTLGVVIGVLSVVAMSAVGQGAKSNIETQILGLGKNVLMIFAGSSSRGGTHGGMGTITSLTVEDAEAIARECPSVEKAAPGLRASGQAIAGENNWATAAFGTTPAYLDVRNWPLARGEFFTEGDVRNATKVTVLGSTVATKLFGEADPVGSFLRFRNIPFKVVGVLSEKGQSLMGSDQDDTILMPLSTVQKRLIGVTHVNSVFASARSSSELRSAEEEITSLLRQRHRIPPEEDDDFFVRNQADIIEMATTTSRTMILLLGIIASISLVVGGIGIMNIMLVSVTERTREIGVRMAVGARGRDILSQFLTESVVLSVAGGAIGVALGIALARFISSVVRWPVLVSPPAVLIAFSSAIAVGVFFGLYPATKASRLDPIQALRYE